MSFRRLKCNFVDRDGNNKCEHEAVWEVWFGSGIDDFTLACKAHIGDLLTDENEHRLFRVDPIDE